MGNILDELNYGGVAPQEYQHILPMSTPQTGVSGSFKPQMGTNGQVGMMNGRPVYQTPQLTGWQKFGYAMDGLGAIGGLWGSIQENKIAKEQLALSREAYNTNMNNSIQTYNTDLEGRIRAQYAMEGRSNQADAYIEKNKLSRS